MSQEKPKSLSEQLSEACPKKEEHAKMPNGGRCSECGHINAKVGSKEYLDATYRAVKEADEAAEDPEELK